MATTDVIIDECLKAIGEPDPAAPVEMSRAEVLGHINQIYQYDIGTLVRNLAVFSWDSSDAAHAIIDGEGKLPGDYLKTVRVYDGDVATGNPLEWIEDIEDKVGDTDSSTQYMIPNPTTIWIFGKTPTNTIKMYYYQRPDALNDSPVSSPSALKSKFHMDIFIARIKELYAIRQNNTYDQIDQRALIVDYLDQISYEHSAEYRDNAFRFVVDVGGY